MVFLRHSSALNFGLNFYINYSPVLIPVRAKPGIGAILNPLAMEDQYLQMLQYAAAVPAPLRLEVTRAGAEPETVTLAKPFLLIGRDPSNDIVIPNNGVSSRHLYLQAIGSRIAAIDLNSRSGTEYHGENFSGWLSDENRIQIPGTELQLTDSFWVNDPTLQPPLEFRPRDQHRAEYGALPKVELELLNTSAKGKTWPINRVITLIGRDERCRITIVDKRIARTHCALLLLPSGLWVVDLSGRGEIQVNGQACRCMMIADGVELQIGPYLVTARYPEIPAPIAQAPVHSDSGEREFLTQHNRIFKTHIFGDTIVILPQGDSQEFFYQDIHVEANRVIDVIKRRKFQHVVIDFSQSETVGHILVESLCSFCRSVPGKSALSACTVGTYEMLHMTKLFSIWPHYQTRQDAMQAVILADSL